MNDAAANLLLGLLTLWPAAYVVSDALPLGRHEEESWLDWFWRLVHRPGSCVVIAGCYWLGVAGAGPFSESPGWVPVLGAGWIGVLALGTAGERQSRSNRRVG
jgi:hypothetical protein